MENLARDKIKKEEICLVAPCGIYCGACDPFLGRSKDLAKELYRIINGFNIVDVAPIVLDIEQEKMKEFMVILEKLGMGKQCPGCNEGGGNPVCPIKMCAKEKGFLTCAECEKMPCNLIEPDKKNDQTGACFYLEMIMKRYSNWNIKNLERIQEIGYRQFIDEMQEKVKNGFLTSDVISSDMVITDSIQKMSE